MSDFPRVAVLQSSSPGVQQAGNVNISGVMLASRLVAGASVSGADIEINKTVAGSLGVSIQNASSNAAAYSQVELKDDAGTHGLRFSVTSSGATPASQPDLSAFGTSTTLTLGTTDGTAVTISGVNAKFAAQVGVGADPGTYNALYVVKSAGATGANAVMSDHVFTVTAADANTRVALRGVGTATHTSGVIGTLVGAEGLLNVTGSGGTVTAGQSLRANAIVGSGATITTRTGLYVVEGTGAGSIGTQYGIYVEELTKGGTADYAIYTSGATKSYFGGVVGFGTDPTDATRFVSIASSYGATSAVGVTLQAICSCTAAETNVREAANIVTTASHTSGSLSDIRNVAFTFNFTGNGGTVALARNIVATCNADTGVTVTTRYGYHYFETSGAGTLGTQYAVYIDALTKGGTANWAIYTVGATKSFFGGNVMIGGGTASASNPGTLTVSTNTAALPTGFTDSVVHVSGADSVSTRLVMDAFMGSSDLPPNLTFRAAAGTAASPTAVSSTQRLGMVAWFGRYDGSNYCSGNRASITCFPGESWDSTHQGTYLSFQTTVNATTTVGERMRIHTNGFVGVGSTAPPSQFSVFRTLSDTVGNCAIGLGYSATLDVWGFRVSNTSTQSFYIDRYYNGWADSPFVIDRVTGYIGLGTTPNSIVRLSAGVDAAGGSGNEVIGVRTFASRTGAESSANTTGLRSEGLAYFTASSQTIAHVIGVTAKCEGSQPSSYTGDVVGDATSILTDMVVGTGVTITNVWHLHIPNASGSGAVTTQYGIKIEDLTKGSTNYSIYTGVGYVSIGGVVVVRGGSSITLSNSLNSDVAISSGICSFSFTGGGASCQLGGMVSGSLDGFTIIVRNATGSNITIVHESTSSSTANRFQCPSGVNKTWTAWSMALFVWTSSASRWQVLCI